MPIWARCEEIHPEFRGPKLRLVGEFLGTTGLRISELIGIRVEDVKKGRTLPGPSPRKGGRISGS